MSISWDSIEYSGKYLNINGGTDAGKQGVLDFLITLFKGLLQVSRGGGRGGEADRRGASKASWISLSRCSMKDSSRQAGKGKE